jgi:hypothetical protein
MRHVPTASRIAPALALFLATASAHADVSIRLDSGTGFVVTNAGGAIERLRVDEASGNVSRNGALFVHTTGSQNLFVGPGAGNASTSGLGGNVAFGTSALQANTTGAFDTAVGALALFSNTTGHSNTAVGRIAMFSNTTGYANSAVGAGALYANSGGIDNAALGSDALRSNTTGSANVAVGGSALRSSTTGHRNAAVGSGALRSNTTGSYNTAVGWAALFANSTGASNSGFGRYALRNNTTGFDNAAVGALALRQNTTGEQNAAFGRAALYQNTSGSRNVAIGQGAGGSQTTGNDNIYIANVGVAGESGQIRIGNPVAHTQVHIAAVHDVTSSGGIPVLVSPFGTLGTTTSSARFKRDVEDLGDASDLLMRLRPVRFHYLEEAVGAEEAKTTQYGLIAEEVAQVAPELVAPDTDGKPYSVKYHVLPALLLNEVQRQRLEIAALRERLVKLEAR